MPYLKRSFTHIPGPTRSFTHMPSSTRSFTRLAWPGTELHPHAGLHTELHSHAGTDTSARLTVEIGCSVVRKQASLPVRLAELFCSVLPVQTCSPARPAVELRCSVVRDLLTRQACRGAVSQSVCGLPLFAQRSGRL